MSFGVFIHRTDSIYDDTPAERYHFPRQYLGRVEACVGAWIIYYEPRRALNSRGYFALAKVQQVIPDPNAVGMYFAIIEAGSFLEFPNEVPFRNTEGLMERGLLNEDGRITGRAQSAVRSISVMDFNRIIEAGFSETEIPLPRTNASEEQQVLQEDASSFLYEQERSRLNFYVSRVVRDRIFRRVVLQAYDSRCSITGLKLINGGGRVEAEAAHIRPVEANGPDSINNGIALSGTVHWMFDRGLISLEDDLQILVSRHVNDPNSVRGMINANGAALPPMRASDRPHPHFLRWHREHCFKH